MYSDKEKIRIYESVFHQIKMYREVAMNPDKVRELLDLIGDWSYAHRIGKVNLLMMNR